MKLNLTLEELLNNEEGIRALDIDENYSKAYDMVRNFDRPKLTHLLLEEGINPLDYISYIPAHYMNHTFTDSLIILSHITHIGQEAFIGCKHIPEIRFEEGLKRIGMLAFSDCFNIEKLDFPNSLEVIDDWAFAGCSRLKEVHFKKDNLSYISTYAFGECKNLKTITYNGTSEEWKSIGIRDDAFKQCGTKTVICIDGTCDLIEE